MAFTEDERAEWYRAKREREAEKQRAGSLSGVTCIICLQPIALGDGDLATEYPVCNACD